MILDLETPDFRSLLHTLKIEVILLGLWRVVGLFFFLSRRLKGKLPSMIEQKLGVKVIFQAVTSYSSIWYHQSRSQCGGEPLSRSHK